MSARVPRLHATTIPPERRQRLSPQRVDCFRADGSLMDLAWPVAAEVEFNEMAGILSRIARFNGTPQGGAFSVAQHSVLGAEALLLDGADELTAALFLLHDGHEYRLGDWTRPAVSIITTTLCARGNDHAASAFLKAVFDIKSAWDEAIYTAAGLPPPSAWTPKQQKIVKLMDERMLAAESRALFGRKACPFPGAGRLSPPKLDRKNPWRCWGPAQAEENFLALLTKLIGRERVMTARFAHAAHVSTLGQTP